MDNKLLLKKFQKFKKNIKQFVIDQKSSVEDIHELRLDCREMFSLMSADDRFYKPLKKVIKISNSIRDIDVFHEEYLDSLPKHIRSKLKIKTIRKYTDKSRNKKLSKLYTYLELLDIPKGVEFEREDSNNALISKVQLISPNQEELHKYRIFIKKRLYKEKNSFVINKKLVKILTNIKNILGTINDNINGLKRLKSYNIDDIVLKEIEDYTENKNLRIFKKFKELESKF